MRYKRIENTLIYTHLIRFSNEEFASSVARTVDEARKLVEAGFECITEIDEVCSKREGKRYNFACC